MWNHKGRPVVRPAPAPPEPTGTILLVDDDASCRKLYARLLEKRGHRVIQAANTTLAVRLASVMREIDLLITDYDMPGKSGPDLARWFTLNRRATKILIISSSPTLLKRAKSEAPWVAQLAKAAPAEELFALVARLIQAHSSATQHGI